LVDLHGQHDHQLLLREENHRDVVDVFSEIKAPLRVYQREFSEMKRLQKALKSLKQREQELEEKLKLYRFQVDELQKAELDLDEEEELDAEINLLDNAEALDQ